MRTLSEFVNQVLSASIARAIAAMCVAVFVITAHTAHAGINVWTSHGPPGGTVLALAIDPSAPSTLYAGTYSSIFKSTDAGATWGVAGAGLPNDVHVFSLAIDPGTPSTLYAGMYGGFGGVFKSTDAGATWGAASAGLPNDAYAYAYVFALAIDPSTPSTLYAGTYSGVFKSTDAGATWGATGPIYYPSIKLVIDPNTPSTLYAVTNDLEEGFGGVFKSTDAGATWGAAVAGRNVRALAIDPSAPSTLYSGTYGSGVLKSTDAGATWGAASAGLPSDVFALAIDPNTPSTLYAGTGGGVFKSTDAGATWTAFNAGLTNTSVLALAIDPITPSKLYAGTNGGGVFAIEQVATCAGDCNIDGTVTVDELVTGVNIALGTRPVGACPTFDVGNDGQVTVDELIAGVNNALNGCPAEVLSGTLLVTDDVGNKLYTLDAATGDVLASADTGEVPVGVEKANGKVYVANEESDTISVFESATLSPLTVIPACDGPHHAAASPDGTRFYAACVGTNKVAVVDTETDTLVGLLTSGEPGAGTHAPWPTKDGERLWVANHGTNDITEIDLQTGAILRVIPTRAEPNEVVVPADAKTAYVSVPLLGGMMVYDLETNQLVAELTRFAPAFLMLSSDDKTILSSWAGFYAPTAVAIFDTETLTSVDVTLPGFLATHTDLTPHAKFGFVSLVGPQSGIAVVDIDAAALHAFYPIPGIVRPHGVRYAPGPP